MDKERTSSCDSYHRYNDRDTDCADLVAGTKNMDRDLEESLLEFLRNNLRIQVTKDYNPFGTAKAKIYLLLAEEIISEALLEQDSGKF